MAFVDDQPVRTAKGNGYRVRWRDAQGRSREKVHYVTKAQANKIARQVQSEVDRGVHIERDKAHLTFRQLAEIWLAAQTNPSADTVQKYRRNLELWVYPTLGDVALDRLTHRMVAEFYNKLRRAPSQRTRGLKKGAAADSISAATVVRVFGPVVSILDYGVRQEYLRRNPAAGIEYRVKRGRQAVHGIALEWDAIERIAAEASAVHPLYGTVVRFIATVGVRASELAGLQLGDYVPGDGIRPDMVQIRRVAKPDAATVGGFRYDVTKSGAGMRDVPVDSLMAAEMRAYLAEHPRGAEPTAPLFPRRRAGGEFGRELMRVEPFNWGAPLDPGNFRRRVFDPACTAAGVGKVRLHDARHTAGSLWLAAGWNPLDVSRTLGHSSVDFSMRTYAKQMPSQAQVNSERLAAYKLGRLAS